MRESLILHILNLFFVLVLNGFFVPSHVSFDHLLSFINVMFYKLRIPRQSDEVKHFKQSDEGQSGKTQTRHTHTQHNTHTTQPHRE